MSISLHRNIIKESRIAGRGFSFPSTGCQDLDCSIINVTPNPPSACPRNVTTNPSVFAARSTAWRNRVLHSRRCFIPYAWRQGFFSHGSVSVETADSLVFQTSSGTGRIRTFISLVNSQPLPRLATVPWNKVFRVLLLLTSSPCKHYGRSGERGTRTLNLRLARALLSQIELYPQVYPPDHQANARWWGCQEAGLTERA